MKRHIGNSDGHKSKKGHWALGLLSSMKNEDYLVQSDDRVTMIKDMYPKALYHYLVLPNESISNLKALDKKHLSLLEHMHEFGENYVHKNHPYTNFIFGYHSEASMHHLHLHVISNDMNSSCLKTKKHWNSFNSDFFLHSKGVIENLKRNGKVLLPLSEKCKEYLNTPLKCNQCDFSAKNMPGLKTHLLSHVK